MSPEARHEFDVKYEGRIEEIREAAAAAIRRLDQLRSVGPMPRETLDVEIALIARENLHPFGCDLVIRRGDHGVSRFLIKVQSTRREYDLVKSFPIAKMD